MDSQRLISGDSSFVVDIVKLLKSKGIFDEFRHECLADVDTKSSCQNLSQRVDGYASKFLANETWHPDMNKNELRNKLRRHIDESGMLAVGADHVVEQVINPKIHQSFLPKIVEVVNQFMKEQSEKLNRKPDLSSSDSTTSENTDASDTNKAKTSVLDPIADILSFSYSKSKPTTSSNVPSKIDNNPQKQIDVSKIEKKKEEKSTLIVEKNVPDSTTSENPSIPVITDTKPQTEKDKEKVKKDDQESPLEASKKAVKEEIKPEKNKAEDTKLQVSDINTTSEENKASISLPVKSSVSVKKDVDKNKLKSKSSNVQKASTASSSEIKKPKKESSDKSSEKNIKSKSSKPSKDLPSSPTKSVNLPKSVCKDEKSSEASKSKSSDSSSSKTSESSFKKSSKSSSNKKEHSSSKHKNQCDKTEKNKISKLSEKSDQNLHESASNEKGNKSVHYSSSYDSSQGSDQDKSSSSSLSKERQKHFSKHAKKESSEKLFDKSSESSHKRRCKDGDEGNPSKKHKVETTVIQEKLNETVALEEAAKISSRSNSFGSTSSVSSSSNTTKDNLLSNSDETVESSTKDKKKKQAKEKDPCQNSKTHLPPPSPPPPSSSLSCELTSSAEMSSMEDTQSSSDSEHTSSEELNEQSSSDSELESKESVINTLNESLLNNSSNDDINEFYDIFLYSSSSSEFEGFGNSPEKQATDNAEVNANDSDISISSVHTSDLSSFDDELSDDDFFINNESQPGVRKRLSLKEAEKLLQNKAFLQSLDKNKNTLFENESDEESISSNKNSALKSTNLSSEDESTTPAEPKRSLRRERRLNPRYASSEYTSLFNSRKETFITKQSSPSVKNQTSTSFSSPEKKNKKDAMSEKKKPFKKNSVQSKTDLVDQEIEKKSLKKKQNRHNSEPFEDDKELSDSKLSSSDEMETIMTKESLNLENDNSFNNPASDQTKFNSKLKPRKNANHSLNSYSVKRKLIDGDSPSVKRPCSRGSVDSTSSESVPKENKPFNNEKHNLTEEKIIRSSDFKGSDLTDSIKKDLFCKQRTNNNGDILGQKDIFPKTAQRKTINTPEKKTSDAENSKELNAL